MSRPFKSLVLVLVLLLAPLMATIAAVDTQDPTGPGADTLRSLQQIRKADQSTGFGRHRMLPSVYSTKVTPAAVGVVDTPGTAKEVRRLQGKPGPDFARKMPFVFPHKSAAQAVGVVDTPSTAEGRKLQGKPGPEFARKMPFVFPHKSAAQAVGVLDSPSTAEGRKLLGKPGPDFARKMPYVFPHKSAPEAVGVDTLSLTVNGRKLSNAFDATSVAGIGPASRSMNAHKGPESARLLPSVFSAKVTPAAVGVVETTSTAEGRRLQGKQPPDFAWMLPSVFSAKVTPAAVGVVDTPSTAEGRRLQGKPGPDFARMMAYAFPRKSAAQAVAVDTLSLTVNGRKLSNAFDAALVDGCGPASRDLMAHKGPDFARQLPTTFSSKATAQPVANSDASVSASSSVALGAQYKGRKLSSVSSASSAVHVQGRLLPARNPGHHTDSAGSLKGRKLASFSGAGSVVPGHGRLLPTIRNSGTIVDGTPEGVYASGSVSEHIGARSGR